MAFVLVLHLTHAFLQIEHLLLLLLVGLLEHFCLGKLGLSGLLARFNLLSIAQLVCVCRGFVGLFSFGIMPIALCGIGREVMVLHWMVARDAVPLMLIVELRWMVVPETTRIVHVSLLLLL